MTAHKQLSITDNLNNYAGKTREFIDYNDLYNSFKINWQLNSAYEISFTATYTDQYKDAFNLLEMKRFLIYDGQFYIIQQLENTLDETGLPAMQVTANAMLIDRMKNLRIDPAEPTEDNPDTSGDSQSSSDDDQQKEQQPGTVVDKKTDQQQTFTLQNRLDQFFNNNDQGIKYELHGNFPQVAVDCSGSLYDWLGSNLATFGAYYIPDNFILKIYDLPNLRHQTDMVFRYMSNASNVDIQSDGNDMVNDCDVFGGKIERTIVGSNGSSDSAGTTTGGNGGNLDSVEGFCKSPINADFGVNKSTMVQNFAARSRRAQAWGVDANRLYNVVKQNGVSPEWFFAYELQEQLDTYGRDSWLNHFGYHLSDPYQDAVNVCNWIKQLANTPGFHAATEGGVGNQSLSAQWDKEFGKGTIGRVYLQGTAAAAWELEGIAGGYYGKPLAGCVATLKSWGGHTVKNVPAVTNSWGWPFASIPRNGEPKVLVNGQQFGHTGWFGRGGGDFHDGFDFDSSIYNGNVLAVHPGTVHAIGADLGWWYIWVKSNDGYNEVYQEGFTGNDIYVKVGQQVNTGTPLAKVTQNHTHLGISNRQITVAYYHGYNDDGTWLNPIDVIKKGIASGGTSSGESSGSGSAVIVKKGRADEFVNYCKSFVGHVPYVWGGSTPSGWDCSGFVCYVLNHFGVTVSRTNTVGLEKLGQVVGPPYQTGDLLFWGPHGGSTHTSIAMDATYRVGADNYQDGTVYRTISSYPPSFGVRVSALVKILGGTADSGGTVEGSGTTTQDFYQLHYHYRDEESVQRYGLHRGAPIVMDSIYDLDALQKYVDNTVQHDPPTSISNNQFGDNDFHLGDVARLIVPEKGINFDVTLMGISYNPFNPNADDTTLTWNNTGLTMKNSIYAMYQQIKQINANVDHIDLYGATGGRAESRGSQQTTSGGNQSYSGGSMSRDSSIQLSPSQLTNIDKFINDD